MNLDGRVTGTAECNSTTPDKPCVTSFQSNGGVDRQSGSSFSKEVHMQQTNSCIGRHLSTMDIGTQTSHDSIALGSSVFSELPLTTAIYVNTGDKHDKYVANTNTEDCHASDLEDECWKSVEPHLQDNM